MFLLYASACFEHYVLIIRRSKLYYTSSGIITPVDDHPVHRLREDAKQAKPVHQYKNTKIKLYKSNAAIWYNKTCRIKQLIPTYVNVRVNSNNQKCQRSPLSTCARDGHLQV